MIKHLHYVNTIVLLYTLFVKLALYECLYITVACLVSSYSRSRTRVL